MHASRSPSQRVATSFASVHYRLIGHRSERRQVWETIAGRTFRIDPGVFNPVLHRSGALFAGMLSEDIVPVGSSVLEIGTGCGLLAVTAGQWADTVVAVDVDPVAVRCATDNVAANSVQGDIRVVESDLFAGVPLRPIHEGRFDVVLTNPPFDEVAADGAPSPFFDRFAMSLRDHLAPGGSGAVCLPQWESALVGVLRYHGLSVSVWTAAQSRFGPVAIYRVQ